MYWTRVSLNAASDFVTWSSIAMTTAISALYKYLSPERIDVLKSCQIRYSPLRAFNDPFEGVPDIRSMTTPAKARESFEQLLPEETRRTYELLPSEIRSRVSFQLWEGLAAGATQSKRQEIFDGVERLTPLFRAFWETKLNETVGALCLSEAIDSSLMWSHYAASHSGFAIAFDPSHPHFNEAKSPKDELRHLRSVKYMAARPSGALTDFTGVDLFFTKSQAWAYEREWRILRPFTDASIAIPESPYAVHLFRFPPECIQAVILGARASRQTLASIRAAMNGSSVLCRIPLRKVLLGKSNFELTVVEADD